MHVTLCSKMFNILVFPFALTRLSRWSSDADMVMGVVRVIDEHVQGLPQTVIGLMKVAGDDSPDFGCQPAVQEDMCEGAVYDSYHHDMTKEL